MHKTTEPQNDEATPNRSRGRNNIRAATVGGFYASLAVTRPKVSKAGEDPRSPLRHPGRTDVCRSPNSVAGFEFLSSAQTTWEATKQASITSRD